MLTFVTITTTKKLWGTRNPHQTPQGEHSSITPIPAHRIPASSDTRRATSIRSFKVRNCSMGFESWSTSIPQSASDIMEAYGRRYLASQMSSSPTQSLSSSNPLSGNGSFIPSIVGDDSSRTIRTRIGSLQVTTTTLPRPTKYRPASVTATILPRVIVHLPEGPFLVNASTDKVSIPDLFVSASMILRSRVFSQLPPYWQAANTLAEIYATNFSRARPVPFVVSAGRQYVLFRRILLMSLRANTVSGARMASSALYRWAADTIVGLSSPHLESRLLSADTDPASVDRSSSSKLYRELIPGPIRQ